MNKIIGFPKDEKYKYEFMVVRKRDDGDYDWLANYETTEAYEVAEKINAQVAHNVRVTRKELRK